MKHLIPIALFTASVTLLACNDSGSNNTSENDTSSNQTTADTSMSSAPANPVMMKTIQLGSDQEVPVNNSTGKGTADVSYNKDTKMLTYTINYEGLTGKASMAHIHGTAPRGTNAGVVHDLTGKLQKETKGSFSDSVKVEGNIKEDSLLSGFYYFNIHTPKNPGGEIRGQIEF